MILILVLRANGGQTGIRIIHIILIPWTLFYLEIKQLGLIHHGQHYLWENLYKILDFETSLLIAMLMKWILDTFQPMLFHTLLVFMRICTMKWKIILKDGMRASHGFHKNLFMSLLMIWIILLQIDNQKLSIIS